MNNTDPQVDDAQDNTTTNTQGNNGGGTSGTPQGTASDPRKSGLAITGIFVGIFIPLVGFILGTIASASDNHRTDLGITAIGVSAVSFLVTALILL